MLFKIILERYKILLLVSTLSATLLVLSTINEKLIKNFLIFKLSLTILVLLIPVSVFAFLISLKRDEEKLANRIDEIGKRVVEPKKEPKKSDDRNKKSFWELLLLWIPWIITGLLAVGIVCFILSLFS